MQTKAEATAAAKRCLKKMRTSGWKIRVFENMGWHWRLQNGYLAVADVGYGKSTGRYHAMMSSVSGASGTPSWWYCDATSTDPNKVIRLQLRRALEFANHINEIVAGAAKVLERKEKRGKA